MEQKLVGYVPAEQLTLVEGKVHELESKLSDSVPKAEFDELSAKLASLSQKELEVSVETPTAPVIEGPVLKEEKVAEVPHIETIVSSPCVSEAAPVTELVEQIVAESPGNETPQIEAVTSQVAVQTELPTETIPVIEQSQEAPQVISIPVENAPMEANIVEIQTISSQEIQQTQETVVSVMPENLVTAAPLQLETSSPLVEAQVAMPKVAAEVDKAPESMVTTESVSAPEALVTESPPETTSFPLSPSVESVTTEIATEALTPQEFVTTSVESAAAQEVLSVQAPAEVATIETISPEVPVEKVIAAALPTESQATEVVVEVNAPTVIQEQISTPESIASPQAEQPTIQEITPQEINTSQEIPATATITESAVIIGTQTNAPASEEVHVDVAPVSEFTSDAVETVSQAPTIEAVAEAPAVETVETASVSAPVVEAPAVQTPSVEDSNNRSCSYRNTCSSANCRNTKRRSRSHNGANLRARTSRGCGIRCNRSGNCP